MPEGFELKKSTHLKKFKVNGLHTQHALPSGYVIGEYKGVRRSVRAADEKRSAREYMMDVRGPNGVYVIDAGNQKNSSFIRYSNAANNDSKQNARFVQRQYRIYLVTTRPIPAGREILTWYGKDTQGVIDGYKVRGGKGKRNSRRLRKLKP